MLKKYLTFWALCFIVFLLPIGVSLAQQELIKDINTTSYIYSFDPQEKIEMNGIIYFSAITPTTGQELWRSDGTESGTYIVKDICPGSAASYPYSFIKFKDVLYFTSWFYASGNELWRSDGTSEGTYMVKDIYPGPDPCEGTPYPFAIFNETLFFVAGDSSGLGLWKSDGTEAGTVRVHDSQISFLNHPENILVTDAGIVFSAQTEAYGTELWFSDGTTQGTRIIKDMVTGTGSGNPYILGNLNGKILFTSRMDSISGSKLFQTDGTESGTQLIVSSVNNVYEPVVVDSLMLFKGNNVFGTELWRTNGTTSGTYLIKDIYAGSSGSNPRLLTRLNNELFFTANDSLHGMELWKSDGTTSGTVLVRDILPGPSSSFIERITPFNNALIVNLRDSIQGIEPHLYNVTTAEMICLKDINQGIASSSPNYFSQVGNKIYFSATDSSGSALYASNGTANGTYRVKNIPKMTKSSQPEILMRDTLSNEYIVFAYSDLGRELWKTDGTSEGTTLIKDIWPGTLSSLDINYSGFIYNRKCLFIADDSLHGPELWCSDGTETGTYMVKDISPGINPGMEIYNPCFSFYKNKVVFIANPNHTNKIFMTDGTEEGTNLFYSPFSCDRLYSSKTTLYACSYLKLSYFNESSGNFEMIKDSLYHVSSFFEVNDTIYFIASDLAFRWNNIYKIEEGTKNVIQITNNNSVYFCNLIGVDSINNQFYYCFADSIVKSGLWKSNGSPQSCTLVKNLDPSIEWQAIQGKGAFIGDTLLFFGNTQMTGRELWRSDGSDTGTYLVKDINPGTYSCFGTAYGVYNNKFYFTAQNANSGSEIWVSDGTSDGTHILFETCVPGDGNPEILDIRKNILYFSAGNDIVGNEFWKYDLEQQVFEPLNSDEIFIWPVPADNDLFFKYFNTGDPVFLEIFDVFGKRLSYEVFNSSMVGMNYVGHTNLSGLSAGIYIARFTMIGKTISSKFVKQ